MGFPWTGSLLAMCQNMPAPLSVNVPRIVTVTGQGIVLIQTLKGMIENDINVECNDDDGDDDI